MNTNWIIFTDLDGTLLDHYTYGLEQTLPVLAKINALQIPLIINSSKTAAEIRSIRQQMHNNSAFVVENGAVIFLPDGKLQSDQNVFEKVMLGEPIQRIRVVLSDLRTRYAFQFAGFSDWDIGQLMHETGLFEWQAQQALQRLASEPIKWLDTDEQLQRFQHRLAEQGLQLIKGGRFWHVMGQNDKSLAMAWLLNKFKQPATQTIALGDSQNDLKMLEQADFATVICQHDGRHHLQLDKPATRVIYSCRPAPLGWKEAIEQYFAQLISGECNE